MLSQTVSSGVSVLFPQIDPKKFSSDSLMANLLSVLLQLSVKVKLSAVSIGVLIIILRRSISIKVENIIKKNALERSWEEQKL